jgi:hypothetical protein
MYTLLGITIALAFLLLVNGLTAVFASLVWAAISGAVGGLSANTRARIILVLRIAPVATALFFVFLFVVPSYLIYEPISTGEAVSLKLALIAVASSIGIAVAFFRVINTWLVTRRLIGGWARTAESITITGVDVPVYRIEHPFPVIAVVGILSPSIFVATKVLDTLATSELRAAIAHEYGHINAADNLKRTILRVCRDVLVFPIGKRLDQAWTSNVEEVADECAAGLGPEAALDLASALVKIARIATQGSGPAMPECAFLIEERNADIAWRVRRLVRLSEDGVPSIRSGVAGLSAFSWLWTLGMAFLVVLPLIDERLLASTHEAVESFVRILQ